MSKKKNVGMEKKLRTLAASAGFGLLVPPAAAVDGFSVLYGDSDSATSNVTLVRVAAQWDWNRKWLESGNWHLGGYWELDAGYWDNGSRLRTNSGMWDIGFTPVLRFQQSTPDTVSPYLEVGAGVRILSESSVSAERRFGSAFQFGDHAGVGVRLGLRNAYDLSYRFQHISNAGIKHPNQGINFHQVRLGYRF